jgi:nicotinate-nucleotide--dimethylbenzimidazole phosphoribosyltransferase
LNEWYLGPISEIDNDSRQAALDRQLNLTKPPGSLGRLESIAVDLSAMQGTITPGADRVEIAVFAGDHGVAAEGVSVFPQVVTTEMVKNFIRGGAAISVMSRQLGAGLTVVNAGTVAPDVFDSPVVDRPVGQGTGNIATEPAMTKLQCLEALKLGAEIVDGYDPQTQVTIGGDMGIANTTSATALAAALGVADPASLVGPGTGLDNDGIAHKLSVVVRALARAGPDSEPLRLLGELGGFEIVALAGYFIRAAQRGFTILVDGFICSAAALAACSINSGVRQWMLFSHVSAEPGHRLIMDSMQAEPLLDLGMRLGEGSGAAIALPLLRSACALQNQMATFAEAGVSEGD